MNKRIRELHQQAKDFINEVSDNDGTYQGKEYPEAVREKFAELIVRECADVAQRTGKLNASEFVGGMIADAIKERFGVKE